MTPLTNLPRRLRARLATRRIDLADDTGATTVEMLSWGAVSVVSIVVIGAALQTLGVDVVDYIRAQIGL